MTKETRPVGGYYGGKARLREAISAYFPPHHKKLVSPFAGFASVELCKRPCEIEVLADINPGTVACLQTIRDYPNTIVAHLQNTSWDKRWFDMCKLTLQMHDRHPTLVVGIAALACSAMANQRGGSVSGYSPQQAKRASQRDWSYLLPISDRLSTVIIQRADWLTTLEAHPPTPDTLYYLDPPYIKGGEFYQHTLDLADHELLLYRVADSRFNGKVAISGYESEVYDRILSGWRKVELPAQDNKRRNRTEILWMNYEPNH
jgi:DNA adenine methylase